MKNYELHNGKLPANKMQYDLTFVHYFKVIANSLIVFQALV